MKEVLIICDLLMGASFLFFLHKYIFLLIDKEKRDVEYLESRERSMMPIMDMIADDEVM